MFAHGVDTAPGSTRNAPVESGRAQVPELLQNSFEHYQDLSPSQLAGLGGVQRRDTVMFDLNERRMYVAFIALVLDQMQMCTRLSGAAQTLRGSSP